MLVPSYNHARYVAATLRSIVRQTHAPAELLVIDDGSRDDSPRVIEEVLKDSIVPCELIVRANRGLCATLNEGLARAKSGEYFAYLGSDDLWLPDFLRRRVSLLERRPAAVLGYGHAYMIDAENHVTECTSEWANYADGDAREMLLSTTAPFSPTVLYRRRALERRGWDESAALEDYDLYLRLSADGEFAFDRQASAAWRAHETNTSRDLEMMLTEVLAAQRRNARGLGVTPAQLEKYGAAAVWRHAEDLIKTGNKIAALKLLRNYRGSATMLPRFAALARTATRFLIPSSMMNKRSHAKKLRARQRYRDVFEDVRPQ